MKKAFLFLLCIVIIFISVFAVARLKSDSDANIPNIDTANNTNPDPAAQKIIDVPAICQYPELPTGCESAAAAMVLQYYGVDITAYSFASSWLECNNNFYRSGGKLYGPDPNKVFVGDPFISASYGCFADPIVNAVNRCCTSCTAKIIRGSSIEQLCNEYIDNDKPLLIWATMGMKESNKGRTWYLENGSVFNWIAGEHCLVLVGYNDGYYFLNDPMSGSTVAYQKDIVEKRFAELNKQSVYIYSN